MRPITIGKSSVVLILLASLLAGCVEGLVPTGKDEDADGSDKVGSLSPARSLEGIWKSSLPVKFEELADICEKGDFEVVGTWDAAVTWKVEKTSESGIVAVTMNLTQSNRKTVKTSCGMPAFFPPIAPPFYSGTAKISSSSLTISDILENASTTFDGSFTTDLITGDWDQRSCNALSCARIRTASGLNLVKEGSSSPAAAHTLKVTVTGGGWVQFQPSGIRCEGVCTYTHPHGTSLSMTAYAKSPASFQGWGGACSGNAPTCAVKLESDRSLTATFSGGAPVVEKTLTGSFSGSFKQHRYNWDHDANCTWTSTVSGTLAVTVAVGADGRVQGTAVTTGTQSVPVGVSDVPGYVCRSGSSTIQSTDDLTGHAAGIEWKSASLGNTTEGSKFTAAFQGELSGDVLSGNWTVTYVPDAGDGGTLTLPVKLMATGGVGGGVAGTDTGAVATRPIR